MFTTTIDNDSLLKNILKQDFVEISMNFSGGKILLLPS